jgi:hypothetical protein
MQGMVWTVRQLVGIAGWEDMKTTAPDIRGLMQRMGTEVGREMFGENFWVDAAMKRAKDGDKIVFADVRFPNEADAIKKLGGKVVRVLRDGILAANSHISETALDDYTFDVLIVNSGSLDELASMVEDVAENVAR